MDETYRVLPDAAIYSVLLLGVVLLAARPYWAFLFGVSLAIGIDQRTLIFSRLSSLGQYFNLLDGSVFLCLAAMVIDGLRQKRRIRFPAVAIAMLGVLVMGFANVTINSDYAYETLRALRWGVNIPLFYLIGRNIVTTESRVRALLLTAFVGAIVAELQHVALVFQGLEAATGHERSLRNLAFAYAHSECWLIAGPLIIDRKWRRPWLQVLSALLFVLGMVTSQTRSVVVAAIVASVVYYGWFLRIPIRTRLKRLAPVLAVVFVGLLYAVPKLGLEGVLDSFSERIETTSTDASALSRKTAIDHEFTDWLDGNLLIGRGLYYYYTYLSGTVDADTAEAAYGHVGYITYLSQLGVIGFIVYALIFPGHTIASARRLADGSDLDPTTTHFASLTGAMFIYFAVLYAMSGAFLVIDILPGIFAGAMGAIGSARQENAAAMEHPRGQLVGV